jgi:ABC-type multidrug transport system, ATPase component
MNEIILKNISKQYDFILFENVNVRFQSGCVTTIKGHNGSGKTVLLKIIAGLIKPTSGEILYNHLKSGKDFKIIPELGAFFSKCEFFGNMNAIENLELLASLKNSATKEDIIKSLEKVGLDPYNKTPVKKYSLGMKQRLGIAQAIMEYSDVLILDEPTNALDSEGRKLIYNIIREQKELGKIIIMTSHYEEEIIALSDEIYEFRGGSIEKVK